MDQQANKQLYDPNRTFQSTKNRRHHSGQENQCGAGLRPSDKRISRWSGLKIEQKEAIGVLWWWTGRGKLSMWCDMCSKNQVSEPLLIGEKGVFIPDKGDVGPESYHSSFDDD